jgi:hypothetical protein
VERTGAKRVESVVGFIFGTEGENAAPKGTKRNAGEESTIIVVQEFGSTFEILVVQPLIIRIIKS